MVDCRVGLLFPKSNQFQTEVQKISIYRTCANYSRNYRITYIVFSSLQNTILTICSFLYCYSSNLISNFLRSPWCNGLSLKFYVFKAMRVRIYGCIFLLISSKLLTEFLKVTQLNASLTQAQNALY